MVTIQETFAFLGKVRGYDNRITRLQNTIEALRLNLLPGAIRYDKDRVQTSPQDSTTEIFAKIDEYEREVEELKKKRSDAVLSIDSALSKMKDCKEQRVLLEFYIGRTSIPDIATGMGITNRHCLRLRNNGVSMLAEVLTAEGSFK